MKRLEPFHRVNNSQKSFTSLLSVHAYFSNFKTFHFSNFTSSNFHFSCHFNLKKKFKMSLSFGKYFHVLNEYPIPCKSSLIYIKFLLNSLQKVFTFLFIHSFSVVYYVDRLSIFEKRELVKLIVLVELIKS